MIFTTRGYLPESQVELRETVTEDDDKRVVRTDKYARCDGAWVGNDVHVDLKRGLIMDAESGQLG